MKKLLLTILFASLLSLNCKKATEPEDKGQPITAVGEIRNYQLNGKINYWLECASFDKNEIYYGKEYRITSGDEGKDEEFFLPYNRNGKFYTVEGIVSNNKITATNIAEYYNSIPITIKGTLDRYLDGTYGLKTQYRNYYIIISDEIKNTLDTLTENECYEVKGMLNFRYIKVTNIAKTDGCFYPIIY